MLPMQFIWIHICRKNFINNKLQNKLVTNRIHIDVYNHALFLSEYDDPNP